MIFQRNRRDSTDRRQPGERNEPGPSEHRAAPVDRRVIFAIVSSVGVLAVAATTWIYAGDLTYEEGPPIRADGSGYYVYLPAILLDHDLTLRRTLKRSFKNHLTEIVGVDDTGTTSYTSTGVASYHRLFDRFGVGVAILALPFFAVGHTIALLTGEPQTGFSWPYQAADSAAGLVYVLLGLVLMASTLRLWFSRRSVVVTIIGITFGAAVFQYATYDASYSHAYSFFLVALIARLSVALWKRARVATVAALAVSVGLLGLVRLTNLVILVFCALVGVERWSDLPGRAMTIARNYRLLALGIAVFAVTLLPQFAYWYRITGHPFLNPYPPDAGHLDLLHPHFVGVLFSVRKGLFFWTPLVLLAVVGLPLVKRLARPLFAPAVVYLLAVTWIVAGWSIWWYGGSFGMRALIDAMPVFAFGLAALLEVADRGITRRIVASAIALTIILAVHGMVSYWLKSIPFDQATFHDYLNSFMHWRGHPTYYG